jgi:hypothetical protein
MERFMERNLDEEVMQRIETAKAAEEKRYLEELRDRFAIAALQGLSMMHVAALGETDLPTHEEIAGVSYQIADAMLKARSKAA